MTPVPASVTLGLAQVFHSSDIPDAISRSRTKVPDSQSDQSVENDNNSGEDPASSPKESKKPRGNGDIHQYMSIDHFELLMNIFKSHRNDDGAEGFDIDTFRKVFGSVLGGNLSFDQMTQLFMKIDANSDGSVSWDEFSTYIIMSSQLNQEFTKAIVDERLRKLVDSSHKDLIRRIDYVVKERKYITIGRDGTICMWSPKLKLLRSFSTISSGNPAWVVDAVLMQDQNKLAVVSDDRQLTIFEMMSYKPRKLITIGPLDHNPLCIAYCSKFEDDQSLLLFGDTDGYVNILSFTRRFFIDYASDNESLLVKPSNLSHRDDNPFKGAMTLHRKKVHHDGEWVERIQFYLEINAFVTCSSGSSRSLAISAFERKTARFISVRKGIRCFDYSRRPSYLVTGGRDKIIQLWNPYVLSKSAGDLVGHNATVTDIYVNHSDGHIISLSEDKVIKIWNIRTMYCLQTITDRYPHRPENVLSSIYFDNVHHQLLTGSSKLESWPVYSQFQQTSVRSHEAPISGALFNNSFHQVISGCHDSTVTVWDAYSGAKTFQFNQVHSNLEITAMCLDSSGRRLITGSLEGVIKVWNFNNGQLLRKCIKNNSVEVSAILFVEMITNRYIVAVGWDKNISVFDDDPDQFESFPLREIQDYNRGHRDDILCLTFAPPNVLATGGVDGSIVVWNLETGNWRCHLADPFLEYKSLESKAVEQVVFLYDHSHTGFNKAHKIPLLSAHADGVLRVWDVCESKLVHEFSSGFAEGEGISCMSINQSGSKIILGGTMGHVQVIDVCLFSIENHTQYQDLFTMHEKWKSHVVKITCVNFISDHSFIAGAIDSTIRVWTDTGTYIGTLGQSDPYELDVQSSFSPIPTDVNREILIEKNREHILAIHSNELKEFVIRLWKSYKGGGMLNQQPNKAFFALQALNNPKFELDEELKKAWADYKAMEVALESKDTNAEKQLQTFQSKIMSMINDQIVNQMGKGNNNLKMSELNRLVAIQTHVVNHWKAFTQRHKLAREWQVKEEDIYIPQISQRPRTRITRPTVRISATAIKPENVYKELVSHTNYELKDFKMPEKPLHHKESAWKI